MTKKQIHRIKLEQAVLRIVGNSPMRLSQISGKFSGEDRGRVATKIIPDLEREGFLFREYDGSEETCYRRVAR